MATRSLPLPLQMHRIDETGGIETRTGFVTNAEPVSEWCKNYLQILVPATQVHSGQSYRSHHRDE
jgi:hypothetical protein